MTFKEVLFCCVICIFFVLSPIIFGFMLGIINIFPIRMKIGINIVLAGIAAIIIRYV